LQVVKNAMPPDRLSFRAYEYVTMSWVAAEHRLPGRPLTTAPPTSPAGARCPPMQSWRQNLEALGGELLGGERPETCREPLRSRPGGNDDREQ
jgi:hypothetical protein